MAYQTGNSRSQLDYVLVRKSNGKMVKEVKVVAGEECAPQHNLVVCNLIIKSPMKVKKLFVPRRKIWKLKQDATKEKFSTGVRQNLDTKKKGAKVNDKWSCLKECSGSF